MITNLANNFSKRMHPKTLASAAGIVLDPWQEEMVSSAAPRLLLNCSRQVGKSTTTAVLADYTALYQARSTTLLLSPSLRQSSELFRKCLDIYRVTDRPVPATAETILRLELENGSRIVSLPGNEETIRGISSVDLLIIDESSRVEDSLYYSVLPMLAVSGGRLALLSTPFGTRGHFYEAYKRRAEWHYFEIKATDCPRIPSWFLEEQRENMGEFWFRQEFMAEFLDAAGSAFRAEDIDKIIDRNIETWDL